MEPVLVVGQPTAIDPSRAPGGNPVLWVQVRVLPADILGDAAGTIPARSWDDAKGAYAERVLDLLDRYAPGLRSWILGRADTGNGGWSDAPAFAPMTNWPRCAYSCAGRAHPPNEELPWQKPRTASIPHRWPKTAGLQNKAHA